MVFMSSRSEALTPVGGSPALSTRLVCVHLLPSFPFPRLPCRYEGAGRCNDAAGAGLRVGIV